MMSVKLKSPFNFTIISRGLTFSAGWTDNKTIIRVFNRRLWELSGDDLMVVHSKGDLWVYAVFVGLVKWRVGVRGD